MSRSILLACTHCVIRWQFINRNRSKCKYSYPTSTRNNLMRKPECNDFHLKIEPHDRTLIWSSSDVGVEACTLFLETSQVDTRELYRSDVFGTVIASIPTCVYSKVEYILCLGSSTTIHPPTCTTTMHHHPPNTLHHHHPPPPSTRHYTPPPSPFSRIVYLFMSIIVRTRRCGQLIGGYGRFR